MLPLMMQAYCGSAQCGTHWVKGEERPTLPEHTKWPHGTRAKLYQPGPRLFRKFCCYLFVVAAASASRSGAGGVSEAARFSCWIWR